jgi:hypothetical protein
VTHIEIEMIIPTEATRRHHARGVSLDFRDIGRRMFFVSVIEDEAHLIMWDGRSYEKAIIEAEELAADFDCPVIDMVAA